MKKWSVVGLLGSLVLLILLSGTALAADYYVAPTGADSNPGSAAAPFATLQKAVESVSPGDTIIVEAGTYAGCLIERSGTEGNYITLRAADGAAVLINKPGPENRHDSGIELETWDGDGTVSYWIIQGLEVADIPSWGIDSRGNEDAHNHHITIRSNRVHHCGLNTGRTGIFFGFTDHTLVEYNESYANGEHGIYHSNSGDYPVVRGNRLYDNAGCGSHMNADASMGGDGVITGALIENNYIYNNGAEGGAAINMDGVQGGIVRNNLIFNNHGTGIAVFQQDAAICSSDNLILNNTVIQPADGRWGIKIAETTCTGNKLYNNIVYSSHSFRGAIAIAAPNVDGFESDYNVLIDRLSTDGDETSISLAQWQALGYDRNSFISTPEQLFVAPALSNYHLSAGSPAVDAGTPRPEVTTDIEGTPRPTGAGYDIGAYEYAPQAALGATNDRADEAGPGHITYTYDDTLFRLAAIEGAQPENISAALDALSPRETDDWLNISPDGQWLLLSSERFDEDCQGWSCLALVRADLMAGEAIRTPAGVVRAQGISAVASGGDLIVYSDRDGPHDQDLFALQKVDGAWTGPFLLTGESPYTYHEYPALSADGTRVVFLANPKAYSIDGSNICEVGTDGQGFRVVLTPVDSPAGLPDSGNLHRPVYAPDNGIVFEADWNGERIWRLAPGETVPVLVTDAFGNDNSPCVLPDGRIVSLWLNRPEGGGIHEIKVMAMDGASYYMALTGLDVADIGMGCGG